MPVKGKLAIIKDELPVDISQNLQTNEQVALLTVTELQKITSKKKSQWGFVKLLAHPNSESKIKPLEKILGAKGLYPNKKNGSLAGDIAQQIADFQQGEREIKTDKGGNIQALLGSSDFSLPQLEKNYEKIRTEVINLQPVGWKGEFLKSITISSAMGPGLKLLI